MTGIIQLKNGSRLTAIFVYFFISHVVSKGEASVLEGISDKIPQYLGSYSDEINSIPASILDPNLAQPYEMRQDSLTIQDGESSYPRQQGKRDEFVPDDVPMRTEGFLQSFLKLTPKGYSEWQKSQAGIREGAQESLVDNSLILSGSKRDIKKDTIDYPQNSEKKNVKLILNKAPSDAIQLSKRLPTRNWAYKRWWGGYYRPRPKMDRRAVKSKHYQCLKQCIGAGRLHPIQCHTLC